MLKPFFCRKQNKKNINSLLSAEYAQRVVKVKGSKYNEMNSDMDVFTYCQK